MITEETSVSIGTCDIETVEWYGYNPKYVDESMLEEIVSLFWECDGVNDIWADCVQTILDSYNIPPKDED